jgi:hypothetical protein
METKFKLGDLVWINERRLELSPICSTCNQSTFIEKFTTRQVKIAEVRTEQNLNFSNCSYLIAYYDDQIGDYGDISYSNFWQDKKCFKTKEEAEATLKKAQEEKTLE